MPRLSKATQDHHRNEIRKLLTVKPNMSLLEMQAKLDAQGLHLHHWYIAKLRDKVLVQRTQEIKRELLAFPLADYLDNVSQLSEQLWGIVNNDAYKGSERVVAAATIGKLKREAIEMMLNLGVFSKDGSGPSYAPQAADPPELIATIDAAFRAQLFSPPHPDVFMPAETPAQPADNQPTPDAAAEPPKPAHAEGAVTKWPGGTTTVRFGLLPKQ